MENIIDRLVLAVRGIRNVAKTHRSCGDAVVTAPRMLHGVEERIVLKHLGHVALATISVTALYWSLGSSSCGRVGICPHTKATLDYLVSHPPKIDARDGREWGLRSGVEDEEDRSLLLWHV